MTRFVDYIFREFIVLSGLRSMLLCSTLYANAYRMSVHSAVHDCMYYVPTYYLLPTI